MYMAAGDRSPHGHLLHDTHGGIAHDVGRRAGRVYGNKHKTKTFVFRVLTVDDLIRKPWKLNRKIVHPDYVHQYFT